MQGSCMDVPFWLWDTNGVISGDFCQTFQCVCNSLVTTHSSAFINNGAPWQGGDCPTAMHVLCSLSCKLIFNELLKSIFITPIAIRV